MRLSIRNYVLLLRTIWVWAPVWVVMTVVQHLVGAASSVFSSVLVVKIVYSGIVGQIDIGQVFLGIAQVSIIALLSCVINSLYYGKIDPAYRQKVGREIDRIINRKASETDYITFFDPVFLNTQNTLRTQFPKKTFDAVVVLAYCLSNVLALLLCFYLASTGDYSFLLPALLLTPCLIYINLEKKRLRINLDKKVSKQDRRIKYIKSVFASKDIAEELRLYSMVGEFEADLDNQIQQTIKEINQTGWKLFLLDSGYTQLVDVFLYFGILLFLSLKVANDHMLLSSVLPSTVLMYQMITRINGIAGILPGVFETSEWLSVYGQYVLYGTIVEKREGSQVHEGVLSLDVRNLCFSYPGSTVRAINNLSVSITRGQKIALVGENGAGKSTLVDLLLGLHDNYEGEILINNVELRSHNISCYRRHFSHVLQGFNHYPVSIAKNVSMGNKDNYDLDIYNSLDKTGMGNIVRSLCKGIHTVVTRRFDPEGVEFSRGQYQRLAISRIYHGDASIMVMDEPSSELDPIAEFEMYRNLRETFKGKTVFVTSHRLFAIKDVDQIYYLEKGSIVEHGTHDELMNLHGKYACMFLAQNSNIEVTA